MFCLSLEHLSSSRSKIRSTRQPVRVALRHPPSSLLSTKPKYASISRNYGSRNALTKSRWKAYIGFVHFFFRPRGGGSSMLTQPLIQSLRTTRSPYGPTPRVPRRPSFLRSRPNIYLPTSRNWCPSLSLSKGIWRKSSKSSKRPETGFLVDLVRLFCVM